MCLLPCDPHVTAPPQEKLGNEHKLTRLTRSQLIEIVEREKLLGYRALAQV